MAQTLVIVLEKQNDQPTPSKVLPKSSLSLSCLGELTKSVQGGHAVPSCFLTERSPFTGARPLKAPRQEEPQKVHSDPPSFSLSCQSAANLSQAQTSCAMTCRGAQESQAGRETRLPSLCGPEPWVLPLSICLQRSMSPVPGGSLAHGTLLWWRAKNTFRDNQREVGSCRQGPER